ncbi:hypothetical protein GCM10011450_24950 [Advenella faeciporci]|uniref:Uncharacterized protein n=1 Tax=Advenella faeciporci TaxID=797535 RepID=A0A918JQP5_9BURK|nr:hypothetical protein GCM10011450_24950 [Advenella faeciporci]
MLGASLGALVGLEPPRRFAPPLRRRGIVGGFVGRFGWSGTTPSLRATPPQEGNYIGMLAMVW